MRGSKLSTSEAAAMEILVLLLAALVCGGLASSVASAKGLNAGVWAATGLLFGPLGLIAAAGMPDLKQRRYLRHIAEASGLSDTDNNTAPLVTSDGLVDVDAQRRRILGLDK